MEKGLEKALKELRDEDVEKRLKAVETLAQAKDQRLVPCLVESLGDTEWRVRKTAVEAIASGEKDEHLIEQLLSIFYTEGNVGKKNAAIEALIRLGDRCLHPIFSNLSKATPEVKKFLVEILGGIGSNLATVELVPLLNSEDENLRLATIEAIGKIRDQKSVEFLLPLLTEGTPLIRFAVIKTLERIADPGAAGVILKIAHIHGLERAALEALGKLGDLSSLDLFIHSLRHGSYKIRSAAVCSLIQIYERMPEKSRAIIINRLREIYNREIMHFLMEVLQERDEKTNAAAIRILVWVKEKDVCICKGLVRFLDGPLRCEAAEILIILGRDAVPILVRELHPDKEAIREGIAKILGKIGNPEAVNPLIQLLGDSNGHVREAAALALGRINDPSSARAMLGLLVDQYVSVQESAAEALCYLKNPDIVSRLLDLTKSPKATLRSHAVRILGRMKAIEAVPKISFTTKDEDPRVRRVAIEALGCFQMTAIDPLLISGLADEDQEVRLAALSTIVKRGGIDLLKYIEPLLHDLNIWVRVAAVRALGEQGGAAAKSLLIGMLKDKVGVVQIATIETLVTFRDPDLCPMIYELTKSDDVEVIKVAVSALGELGETCYSSRIPLFLKHSDWGVRAAAIKVLGESRDHSVKGELAQMVVQDPDPLVRQSAQVALDRLSER